MRRTALMRLLALVCAVVVMASVAGVAHAATVTYNLATGLTNVTMPDGATVPMAGFGLQGGPITVPGPLLEANAGDTLVINLANGLPAPVTVIVHGQKIVTPNPVMAGGRVLSFTPHASTFTFPNLKAGTYLYESGTHPSVEVPIGLYGTLIVRPATAGQAYDDPVSAYDVEHVIVLSDVDPTLNQAVASGQYGTAAYPSTVNYDPKYFLINGKAHPETAPLAAANGDRVLLRFVNAGVQTYDPTLNGANVTVIAQDGFLLPFPLEVVSVVLAAGQTKDVIVTPAADTRYALYDRSLNLTNAGTAGVGGMLTFLTVGSPVFPPPVIDSFTATPDAIGEGGSSTLAWATTNAASASIDQGIGSVATTGSMMVSPTATTTYTLTATGPGGAVQAVTTVTVVSEVTETFTSIAAHDGTVLELNEDSNTGGSSNSTAGVATALRIGDDFSLAAGERQYKTIVSFDTSLIPDGATILSATLSLTGGGLVGTNPFTTHGTCYADIVTGSFGGDPALQAGDFQAAATATQVATMSNPLPSGVVSSGALNAAGLAAINKAGITQMRIYFSLDDNDDNADDYAGFYSGEAGNPANRPVLEVTYQ